MDCINADCTFKTAMLLEPLIIAIMSLSTATPTSIGTFNYSIMIEFLPAIKTSSTNNPMRTCTFYFLLSRNIFV